MEEIEKLGQLSESGIVSPGTFLKLSSRVVAKSSKRGAASALMPARFSVPRAGHLRPLTNSTTT